jgi:ADP-ribose pyrophosphatase YjhB (NUDIX family)
MIHTAFILIKKNDKYLLIMEGGTQAMELWCMPGGHVDEGETLEQAAIRETLEEAGVHVKLGEKILTETMTGLEYQGSIDENNETIEVNVFTGEYISGYPHTGEQELDVNWFTKEEIKTLPLRFEFLLDII